MGACVRRATLCALACALAASSAAAHAAGDPPSYAPSVIRLPIRLESAPLTEALESHVPRAIDASREFVLYRPRKEEPSDPDSVWVRYRIDRDPFVLTFDDDRIVARAPVRYWLETTGEGFGAASCGLDSAITGEIACSYAVGWDDAWRLDARAIPLATTYARRCKPKPPGVNFTRLIGPAIDASFVVPAARALVEAIRTDQRIASLVTDAWNALSESRPLGVYEMWLDTEPVSAVVSPLTSRDGQIATDVAFLVHPRIGTGEPPATRRSTPLPEPRVRLFDERLAVAFDCAVRFDSLAASVTRHCAANRSDSVTVTNVRVARRDSAVVVTLDLAGRVTVPVELLGTPRFDPHTNVLSVAGVDFTNATKAALGRATARPEMERLRESIETGLRCDVTPGVSAFLGRLGRGLNMPVSATLTLSGGAMQREPAGTFLTERLLAVRILAVGHADLVPLAPTAPVHSGPSSSK